MSKRTAKPTTTDNRSATTKRAPRRTKKSNPKLDAINDSTLATLAAQKAALERDDEIAIEDEGTSGNSVPKSDLGKLCPEVQDDEQAPPTSGNSVPKLEPFTEFQSRKREQEDATDEIIEAAAIRVRSHLATVNIAAAWIAAGAEFAKLKPTLKKQGAKGAVGWQKAVTEERFGVSYKTADKCIAAYKVFGQTNRDVSRFPGTPDALHVLATKFDQLEEFLDEIRPGTSATTLRQMIAGPKPEKKSADQKRRAAFARMMKEFDDADDDTKAEFFHELSAQWGMGR